MKRLLFLTTILFILGCQNYTSYHEPTLKVIDSVQVIDVYDALSNEGDKTMESMIESIQIIPLETSRKSLVSSIIDIDISDNFIYILDHNNIVSIFDINGHFVKQLKKGQGPEEISRVGAMYFDRKNNYFYVYDQSLSKMMKLKEDGSFVENIYSSDNIIIKDFVLIDDIFLYVRPVSPSGNCEQYVSIADSSLNITETVSLGKVNPRMTITKYLQESDNGIIISKALSKEKFSFQNGNFYKKYILNDNENDIPITGTSFGRKGLEETTEAIKAIQNYVYMGDYWETQNYQGFLYLPGSNQSKHKIVIRNKNTGEVLSSKFVPNSFVNGLDPMFINVSKYSDDILYTYVASDFPSWNTPDFRWDGSNPNNLISDADMEKLRNVKPDDNPIIVLFKLKDEI